MRSEKPGALGCRTAARRQGTDTPGTDAPSLIFAQRSASALPVAAVCLALLLGCAHSVQINSEPSNALVTVDGKTVGKTPLTFVEEAGDKPHHIIVSHPGYEPTKITVERSQVAWAPTMGVIALATLGGVLGCFGAALLANPMALLGIGGGCLITAINTEVGCQTMCAGATLLAVAPSTCTVPAMGLGMLAGYTPLAAITRLGLSPDQIQVELVEIADTDPAAVTSARP